MLLALGVRGLLHLGPSSGAGEHREQEVRVARQVGDVRLGVGERVDEVARCRVLLLPHLHGQVSRHKPLQRGRVHLVNKEECVIAGPVREHLRNKSAHKRGLWNQRH